MSVVPAILATSVEQSAAPERCDDAVKTILFFDGVCGLCNKSVDFVLARNPKGEMKFAPLQGDTAKQLLTPADVENLNTMVLWVEGRTYRKTAAAVRILWQLSLGWQILGTLLWLIPLPLRNLCYSLIARNAIASSAKKNRADFLPRLNESGSCHSDENDSWQLARGKPEHHCHG